MTDGEQIEAGHAAARELAQTERAFSQVRAALLEGIAETKADQAALREHFYHGLQILDGVKNVLLQTVTNGQVAEHSALIRELGFVDDRE